MSAGLPAPLVPPDLDLSAYGWFPLHYRRLMRSNFWRESTDQICRISLELWCEAWQQKPASSLPNDDLQLSEMSGFGRFSVKKFEKIKKDLFRPWILCADNRYYHPTLSEIAMESLKTREKWASDKRRRRGKNEQMSTETCPNVHPVSTETGGGTNGVVCPVPSMSSVLDRKNPSQEVRFSKEEALCEEATAQVIKLPVRS